MAGLDPAAHSHRSAEGVGEAEGDGSGKKSALVRRIM
jgi:hypothetical protein